jgi:hypothetical protein
VHQSLYTNVIRASLIIAVAKIIKISHRYWKKILLIVSVICVCVCVYIYTYIYKQLRNPFFFQTSELFCPRPKTINYIGIATQTVPVLSIRCKPTSSVHYYGSSWPKRKCLLVSEVLFQTLCKYKTPTCFGTFFRKHTFIWSTRNTPGFAVLLTCNGDHQLNASKFKRNNYLTQFNLLQLWIPTIQRAVFGMTIKYQCWRTILLNWWRSIICSKLHNKIIGWDRKDMKNRLCSQQLCFLADYYIAGSTHPCNFM